VRDLLFTLRRPPDQRVDLSVLVPENLQGLAETAIARLPIHTTSEKLCCGDLFKIRMGNPWSLRFEGGSDRFDFIGAGMTQGDITVMGSAGQQAGRLMRGGRVHIGGDAGPYAASRMSAGRLEIDGNAGDSLGGPLAGEMAGMAGGVVIVRGNAGSRAGDRLRRGLIVVEGRSEIEAGCRMLAGTLVLRGHVAGAPGMLMRRGTIIVANEDCPILPTFIDCGPHRLVAARLLAAEIERLGLAWAGNLKRSLRRFMGDMATLGKGEIFVVSPSK
jgi:formylmethanofuran dehydrogenase subunit C